MILPADTASAGVGTHAGWALTFHRETGADPGEAPTVLSVSSDHHDGQIEATLPGGLEGGVYTVTVEGLSDADYQAIAQDVAADPPSVMKLHLFWYDTTSSVGAYLANVAGVTSIAGRPSAEDLADRLVAVLTVVSVTRRVGTRHYETVITARERVYERLGRRVVNSVCKESPKSVVEQATREAGVKVDFLDGFTDEGQLPPREGTDLGTAMTNFVRGNTYRKEIGEVGTAVEQSSGRYGRGVLLIRDGMLYVGVRPGPLGGGEPVPLSPRTGLVEVAAAGLAPEQSGTAEQPAAPARRRHTLVLKGRPDLKPGAVVQFDLPPTEKAATTPSVGAAIAGPLLGPLLPSLPGAEFADPRLLYVDSVSHRFGRTTSFVTTVSGVEVETATAEAMYDPPPPAGPEKGETGGARGGDNAVRAARAVQSGVREALSRVHLAEAGEVRLVTSSGDGSADEPPRHTATVWRGLADPDGHPNRLARLPVVRTSPDIRQRVPHVTPFAWGSTGLVVPRYPGTRVLLAHGKGDQDDPVDLGALWESGTGPDAEPGDWWLILPVGVPAEQRGSLADSAKPEPHTGPVTQDLIDADGNRVIEVGELTIRVTRDALASAGTRPARAATPAR
ncbi:hypothetical protein ACFQ1L_34425 [Phytohabitans flavus]|uniref:hypothetical protein n=1 Tax=Phytohabitans flavus TaxID=1076124 RepID=UPI00363722CC